MNKVLITGGNGLLGANTARLLYRQGYNVRILIRPGADIRSISDLPLEIYHGSIDIGADVSAAVSGCDFVVHTASVTEQWGVPAQAYEKINIQGTKNIIESCLRHNVTKLVHISTANTMAPGSKTSPGNELGAFTLFYVNSPYINTKYIAQQLVLEAVAEKKLPAVVINPTFMIGPYDSKPSSGKLIRYALDKKILFYPPGGKNFVHVQDVAACIAEALKRDCNGATFLAAAENLTYGEFFTKIHQHAGQNPLMIKIPAIVLLITGLIGNFIGWITGKKQKLNYSSARLLCLDNYYSGEKSETYLNVKYRPVKEAIKDAIAWFENDRINKGLC